MNDTEYVKKSIVFVILLILSVALGLLCEGCQSATDKLAESASGKNVNIGGYMMLGEVEVANPDTGTPQGRMMIGRVEYRSRKVAIPADQKVPTTGFFKATQTESLLGTKETVIEYDFTAGSDADAKAAMEALEKRRKEAEEAFDFKARSPPETVTDQH